MDEGSRHTYWLSTVNLFILECIHMVGYDRDLINQQTEICFYYLIKQNTPIKGIDISLRLYLNMACVQQCRSTWQPLECSWWVLQWIYCIFKALNQLWSKLSATNYLLTKYPLDMNFILHKREQIILYCHLFSVQDLLPPMEHSERTVNSTENLCGTAKHYLKLPIIWMNL